MALREFLLMAKRSGYASGETERVTVLDDGGNRYSFLTTDCEYIDTWYGFDPFSGWETVRRNGKTIWMMHYSGRTILNTPEAGDLFRFLRQALREPDPVLPLRGPAKFREENYTYLNNVDGDLTYFSGTETITIESDTVYSLVYHGASITE